MFNFINFGVRAAKRRSFATGGTVTESNGYRTHTFTSSGTLTVVGTLEDTTVYIVAAGGKAATKYYGGNGGRTSIRPLISDGSYIITVGLANSGNSSAFGQTCTGGVSREPVNGAPYHSVPSPYSSYGIGGPHSSIDGTNGIVAITYKILP